MSGTIIKISDFVRNVRFEDIPAHVVDRVKDHLLDTIGIAAVGSRTDASHIARDVSLKLLSAGEKSYSARIIFDGRRCSAAGAAHAGALQIDSYDGHDGYSAAKGHIGVAIVPALSAYAETVASLSGRDALTSLVMAYEIAARCGTALHATVAEHHVSGAWNALGVAALGARLRGLDRDQLRQALGIAEYHGPRGHAMRVIAHPTMLNDGSGWGAHAGVMAAFLAEQGFTGAPAVTIEAEDVASHWSTLGSEWLTLQQYIKPYPICRLAHPLIDAALTLSAGHSFEAAEIIAVEIATFEKSAALFPGMPQNTSMAQLGLPFPVAAALVRGRVGVDEVLGSGLCDPEIERLVAVTTIRIDEAYSTLYPREQCGDITVVLRDGRKISSGPSRARGGPDDPLTRGEVIEKFRSHGDGVLSAKRTEAIEQTVYHLDQPDAWFEDLQSLILAPPDA